MSSRTVTLSRDLDLFLDEQVRNGRHGDAGEVMREALRRYEGDIAAENERVDAVRDVIREGREAIARGEFTVVASPDDAEALLSRLVRRPSSPTPGPGGG